ncbi:APC family permease [Pseudosporangium ferrugineum]|uniref:APC family permease n=1 Tax=Pseudosporangium ferrugineum TaxID=439699 RepID=UPI000D07B7D3|nr:APC family permease [Pseudosporangium ferrugineum]
MPSPPSPAARRFGGASVVFLALAAAAPLTVVTAVVPGAYADSGLLALPLLFVAPGLLLLTFTAGHTAMIRRLPGAGALYTFVARGLGRPAGVGVAWLALLSYNALQIGLYGVVGAAAAPLLAVPWWAAAGACWLVVAVCGMLGLHRTAWLPAVLVLGSVVVIAGYAAANLLDPAGGRITWAALEPVHLADVSRPVLGLLLVAAAFAFVGVETTAAYAADVRDPRRATARAAVLAVLFLTVLYAVAGWAMTVAAGPDRIVAASAGRGSELAFDLAAERLAPWAVTAGRVSVVAGLLAAMLSLHFIVTRYVMALGREHVLSAGLARPRPASLTQSLAAGLVIGVCAAFGQDPVVSLGRRLAVGGGLGILLLLLATSLAALLFLNRHPAGEGFWRRFAAPGLSTVGFGALAYLAYLNFPDLIAVAGGIVLLGLLYGLVLRFARPVVYAGIGLGGAAVVVAPSPSAVVLPQPRTPGAHRPERINRLAG